VGVARRLHAANQEPASQARAALGALQPEFFRAKGDSNFRFLLFVKNLSA
jgi:hypothetical protein